MSAKLLYVYASSRASPLKRLTSNFPISLMRYSSEASNESKSNNMEEKAPSTAEEFIRVAEEKAEGLASQSIDKIKDAAGEAATSPGPVDPEHVKQSFKEPSHSATTSKGNQEPSLPRAA